VRLKKTKTLRASGSENVLGKGGLSVVLTAIDHVSYIHGTCYTGMPVGQQPARRSGRLDELPLHLGCRARGRKV
jgi:hypothetical protein